MLIRLLLLLGALTGMAGWRAVAVAAPSAAADRRPLLAKEAFAAGRYDEALEIFVKLYAETLDPIYLRVIGRCYQNLDQPEKAIHSFREYLRKAPKLERAKRAEIEGFIDEMNELLQRRPATAERPAAAQPVPAPPVAEAAEHGTVAVPPPPPPAPPPAAVTNPPLRLAAPPPAASSVPPTAALPPAPAVLATGAGAPPPETSAAHARTWIWIVAGGLLLAAGAAVLLVARAGSGDPSCPSGTICCPPGGSTCN